MTSRASARANGSCGTASKRGMACAPSPYSCARWCAAPPGHAAARTRNRWCSEASGQRCATYRTCQPQALPVPGRACIGALARAFCASGQLHACPTGWHFRQPACALWCSGWAPAWYGAVGEPVRCLRGSWGVCQPMCVGVGQQPASVSAQMSGQHPLPMLAGTSRHRRCPALGRRPTRRSWSGPTASL